jgi:predicted permease
MRNIFRRLGYILHRQRFDRELAEDMEFHREMAAREGRRNFGNALHWREEARDAWGWTWIDRWFQDLRYAARTLRKSPGFAITAVLTLALGIAANVIVFGVLQALVLRPIDVPHGERVMTLAHPDQTYPIFAYPEVRDVRDGNTAFSAVGAWMAQSFGLDVDGTTQPVWGFGVSGQYFEAVGIRPYLGRLLQRADDDRAGASEAVVLSWAGWKSRFGADPGVVGKTVRINRQPYTVVGVAPEGFYGTEKFLQPSLYIPLSSKAWAGEADWRESRRNQTVWSIVRLKDGVTMPQAKAELNRLAAGIRRQYPKDEEKLSFKLIRPGLMGDFFGAPARAFLAGVMGLAGIVLLAACANLGSLFAARTADRTREIAIRMAIGSGRWRIVRQLLVEAAIVSLVGGACACALAWIALTGLASWHPPTEYPFALPVGPQLPLIPIALAISLAAGVLFGAMPLWQIFRTDPNQAIKSGGSQSGGRRWALRDVLLAAQIALCCVTVTAAFVSLRGLGRTLTMDLGFQPKHAVLTRFELGQAGYSGPAASRFQRRLLDRVSQLPGVVAAAYADTAPLNQDAAVSPVFSRETTDFRPSNEEFAAFEFRVSPGYFAAAQTPLLAGRDVSFADTDSTPAVAIVNRQFARRLFHSEDAVGRYFKNRAGRSIQIVGVAADGKYLSLSEDPQAAEFFPALQQVESRTALIVRLRPDSPDAAANEMAATIRQVIRSLDPGVPVRQSSAWRDQLGLTFFVSQVATAALGLFGAFGLLLSIAGTFGLASYTVSKRLRELSLRVALGAQAKQILATALGRMLILLGSGSVVGILLGAAASRLLSAVVYHASAQDPFVLGAVVLTMALTGALSVAAPVRRALRVDPARLLREQ